VKEAAAATRACTACEVGRAGTRHGEHAGGGLGRRCQGRATGGGGGGERGRGAPPLGKEREERGATRGNKNEELHRQQ
jgi:hypothetical protein